MKNPFKKKPEPVTFIVVDDEAMLAASKMMSKVKIPKAPSFRGLGKAYIIGNLILSKFKKSEIQIIEKKNLTKDEAYQQNVNIFKHLIEQRNAIKAIIEHMVQPLIKNVAGVNVELNDHNNRIVELERTVIKFQEMLFSSYVKAPVIPVLSEGKQPWKASMRDAAVEIINNFLADGNAEIKQYRHLRDASDDFYDRHQFDHKQNYTKDKLYANVKKENMMQAGD